MLNKLHILSASNFTKLKNRPNFINFEDISNWNQFYKLVVKSNELTIINSINSKCIMIEVKIDFVTYLYITEFFNEFEHD